MLLTCLVLRIFPLEKNIRAAIETCEIYSNPSCQSMLLEIGNIPTISHQLANMEDTPQHLLFDARKFQGKWINSQVTLLFTIPSVFHVMYSQYLVG